MQVLTWLVSLAAYLNIAFVVWALIRLEQCNSNDGCLGFVWYVWQGCGTALLILALGGALWIVRRRRGMKTGLLSTALGILFAGVFGFLAVAMFFRP
jgi:hypothetical protein